MDLFVIILLFCIGVFFIVKGSDFLVDACLMFSNITGISQVVIGATFISLVTALPEITISFIAIREGLHHLAVGNAIGSMVCNVCLVLGAAILLSPQKVKLREFKNKGALLIFLNILLFFLCFNFYIDLFESILLIIICVLFFQSNFKEAKRSIENKKQDFKIITHKKRKIIFTLLQFIIGVISVFFGSRLLVATSENLSIILKIKSELIGYTLLAFSTCLPELVTTLLAIKKQSIELALGNIVGANIINITLLFGLGGIVAGTSGLFISKHTLFMLIPMLFMISLLLLLPIFKTKKTHRFQGIMLLAIYVFYTIFILSTLIVHTSR